MSEAAPEGGATSGVTADAPVVQVRAAADGAVIVASSRGIDPFPPTLCSDLVDWATRDPGAIFLGVRAGDGWATIGYGQTLARVRGIGAALLRSSATPDAPLAIIAENSIGTALLLLAAAYVGIPFAPISAGYATPSADPDRLREILAVLGPGLIFAGDAGVATRVAAVAGDVRVVSGLDAFAGEDPRDADAAFAGVGPETIVKIMFTSGSTGTPKGVITTNAMLAANQTQTAIAWPELAAHRPVIVDWLPWSHVMGGSHLFGMVLRHGGTLYVDAGRPVGGGFAETVRTLREIPPTMHFSVPRGFSMLLDALHDDAGFARIFFSRLRGLGNAGATLPNVVREELIRLSRIYGPGAIRVTSSWGMTETAPFATTSWGPIEPDHDTIGTPGPGVEIKLAPLDGRYEMRIKGPNVTRGYWRNPAATAAAFDADGFFRTGDAAAFKDIADPSRGLVFGGRLAENFKLSTGTWVNVGALRLALIERGAPFIEDVVFTGHDGDAIGALVFLRAEHAARLTGGEHANLASAAKHPRARAFVANVLAEHNAESPGSSTRIARALIVPDAPDRAHGEVTDKGSINQRRALAHRAALVTRLHAAEVEGDVIFPHVGAVSV